MEAFIPIHHIFQIQEEICNGAAFFVAVAVPAVIGRSAQALHELGGCNIGGTGEGGDAVVAVEGAIVKGLGVRYLCAIEQLLAVVQLLDLLEKRRSIIFFFGIIIVCDGKTAEKQCGMQQLITKNACFALTVLRYVPYLR